MPDAVQYTGTDESAAQVNARWSDVVCMMNLPSRVLRVITRDGALEAHPGDWIVRGPDWRYRLARPLGQRQYLSDRRWYR
jgi:hypothetical protein